MQAVTTIGLDIGEVGILASLVIAGRLDLSGHLINALIEVMQVPGKPLDPVHHSRH